MVCFGMMTEPARPPEAATGNDREFVNQGSRVHPDTALAAQATRNRELLAAQEQAMRG
jgi:hypothetical protein